MLQVMNNMVQSSRQAILHNMWIIFAIFIIPYRHTVGIKSLHDSVGASLDFIGHINTRAQLNNEEGFEAFVYSGAIPLKKGERKLLKQTGLSGKSLNLNYDDLFQA